jgi:hypothetical protein
MITVAKIPKLLSYTGLAVLAALIIWENIPELREAVSLGSENYLADQNPLSSGLNVPDLFVAYANNDNVLYGVEDNFIFRSTDGGLSFERRGVLPDSKTDTWNRVKETVARSKLVRKLRKSLGTSNLIVLKSGTLVIFFDRKIYRSVNGGTTFSQVYDASKDGFIAPFPHGLGGAVDSHDNVYFGEYYAGPDEKPINILAGHNDGQDWQVVHEFAPNEIRHIHSLTFDPYRNRVWVCTGDDDHESNVLYTDDGFRTIKRLGGGSQDWRVVSLIPTEDYLYWGSDNDRTEGSSIFRWSFSEERLEHLQYVGKPFYYSDQLADGTLLMSNVYEPESPFSKSNDPHPSAELWISRDGVDWQMVLQIEARVPDRLGARYKRARIVFPRGIPTRRLIYSLIDTSEQHLVTHIRQPVF